MKITKRLATTNDLKLLKESLKNEEQKKVLRVLREKECYPIINRGELWYNFLTNEQKMQLRIWYQLWLDVTETFEIPVKPEWLK